MKRIIIGMVLLLCSTATLAASGYVNVTSNHVEWIVDNQYNTMMYCTGTLYGRTQHGLVYNEDISVVVYPYSNASRYMYTWGNAYFVEGWANVSCSL